MNTLQAPVPAAADYSVSADLWQRLADEIKLVSDRIDAGEELVPEDVANIRKLKSQVDNYVTGFNRAMTNAQAEYRKMVNRELSELGFDRIEQFVARKRQEQNALQDSRIAHKMECLKTISDGLLERTGKLKNVPMAKELLPAFTARFTKVQSGAKNNDITDWTPYTTLMSRTLTIMDTFFCDPKYEDAVLLPLYSGTIREFLAYAKDGKEEHLANVPVRFKEDQHLIHEVKLKQKLNSKADGIRYIRKLLNEMDDTENEALQKIRAEQTWEEIVLTVRLINQL